MLHKDDLDELVDRQVTMGTLIAQLESKRDDWHRRIAFWRNQPQTVITRRHIRQCEDGLGLTVGELIYVLRARQEER